MEMNKRKYRLAIWSHQTIYAIFTRTTLKKTLFTKLLKGSFINLKLVTESVRVSIPTMTREVHGDKQNM